MRQHIMAMAAGLILDFCFGDPRWLPHPVRGIGLLIGRMEVILRRLFPKNRRGERMGGIVLVAGVLAVTGAGAFGLLWVAGSIHPYAGLLVESILCYQMLAAKGLKTESMKVWQALKNQDVEGARAAVSMIVGRDTKGLSKEGIIKAAVETVAENTSDGVIAPLLFMAAGGGGWAVLYKAVNTMDSMVGYKNETYFYFGWAAARLDDLLNLIPSRISALLMILSSFLLGLDGKRAVKIYLRDRRNHKSPNSAQTEAVCAGALDVQLAGDAYYFGTLYKKPTIGDDIRPIETDDIRRANRLLYMTAVIGAALCLILLW